MNRRFTVRYTAILASILLVVYVPVRLVLHAMGIWP
jgi:hypothetical protein